MSLSDAFNYVIKFQKRVMEIHDIDSDTKVNLEVAPSNYFRDLAGVAEMQIQGQEFVVTAVDIFNLPFEAPKRGQVLIDSILGENTISEVRPMLINGNLVGYRIRTA